MPKICPRSVAAGSRGPPWRVRPRASCRCRSCGGPSAGASLDRSRSARPACSCRPRAVSGDSARRRRALGADVEERCFRFAACFAQQSTSRTAPRRRRAASRTGSSASQRSAVGIEAWPSKGSHGCTRSPRARRSVEPIPAMSTSRARTPSSTRSPIVPAGSQGSEGGVHGPASTSPTSAIVRSRATAASSEPGPTRDRIDREDADRPSAPQRLSYGRPRESKFDRRAAPARSSPRQIADIAVSPVSRAEAWPRPYGQANASRPRPARPPPACPAADTAPRQDTDTGPRGRRI